MAFFTTDHVIALFIASAGSFSTDRYTKCTKGGGSEGSRYKYFGCPAMMKTN